MRERCELTEKQVAALRERFGASVDVDREICDARNYAEHIHRGRPYANYGRFVWNWCARAEQWRRERGVVPAQSRTPAPPRLELTRAEIEAMLSDDSPAIRELAAERLRLLDSEGGSGHD